MSYIWTSFQKVAFVNGKVYIWCPMWGIFVSICEQQTTKLIPWYV